MPEVHIQNCPLCSNEAKFSFIRHDRHKYYSCQSCNDFIVSLAAEEKIASSSQDRRSLLSVEARKSNDEKILSVTMGFVGEAYQLNTEFVSRKDVRQ